MIALRAVWLCVLVLPSGGFAADRSTEFCAAWTKAAKGASDYDQALQATLSALGADDLGGDWGQTLRAVGTASPGDHLLLLRGGAKALGETFSCPAFETPSGAPKFTALLEGEQASGIDALAADDQGLYVLRTARVGGFDQGMLWAVGPKGPRPLAEGLARPGFNAHLVLTPTSVLIALRAEILLVPRGGGEPKRLATGLELPWSMVVDGDGVVFVAGGALHRVPLAGGPVQQLAALGDKSQRVVIAVDPGGFLVGGFMKGQVVRVPRGGAPTTVMSGGASSVFALGPDLYLHTGSDAPPAAPPAGIKKFKDLGGAKSPAAAAPPPPLPDGTYRLGFADAAPVRVGPWFNGQRAVVSQGIVLALDETVSWPGRRRLISWKPGGAPKVVATPVGETERLAVAAKRVYWVDSWFGRLFAAPR